MIRRRFTLFELLVVMTIMCALLALILPAVNAAREAARRASCGNGQKQLCLALQNYHDTFLYFPYGARERTTPPAYDQPTFGASWFVAIAPFCEASPFFMRIVTADVTSGTDYASAGVRRSADGVRIKFMHCPSSPLPVTERLGGIELLLPSYAGIMGANALPGSVPINDVRDPLGRFAVAPYGGIAAANGLLPINESLPMSECWDGTANTIIIGEVSDWFYNDRGQKFNPALAVVNAGEGPKPAGGWLAGTDLNFKVRKDGSAVPADRVFNLITIEHPIGVNNRRGTRDAAPNWGSGGVGRSGLNNPLLSAHTGGALVGFADGHVQLLTKDTAEYVLRKLAIRDENRRDPESDF